MQKVNLMKYERWIVVPLDTGHFAVALLTMVGDHVTDDRAEAQVMADMLENSIKIFDMTPEAEAAFKSRLDEIAEIFTEKDKE